ncbi:type II toxin-antitoxin system HicB family antitoxin [Sphaerimonospora mesophila]|uniref:type II toxin-antitoxin system HicB family antitoxin n=1 Tax=Sphaerimonospora mesophila TaxID=37483 RepID=UPI0007C80E0A
MGGTVRLTATVTADDKGLYCARCVQVEVAAEGGTVDEALARLREALVSYFRHRPLPEVPSRPPIVMPVEIQLPG